ncbi:hypothetical protein I5J49_gp44 [Mycobacterium phage ThulaThula]|uniref:DUF732 domain-containing protein n=1 Tax=Mycobacterium phage ThulaThula TaxID=2599880 RepID=A0A5J6TJR0_9CAUD|nr:hypothetical protein I5J49_gp44 [Mycobacterium phage ThulaThula]QFG09072.1 hypothetical protein PBI_THULATHULA_44 [Mycobacterium phage ThulaThula]
MSNNSVPNNARPIWTPADARQAAEDAKRHQPVRLRDWVWAPVLIAVAILGVGLLTGCSSTVEGTPTAAESHSAAGAPAMSEQEIVDRAFILTLDDRGITYTSEPDAITAGHAVCDVLAEADGDVVAAAMAIAQGTELSLDDSSYLVGAASAAYCPEYVDGLIGGN